jgi:hypothetical protein
MKIEMGKKYTSNGEPIRILCTDRNLKDYPVIGLGDDGFVMYFTENGSYTYGEEYDLIEVWEPQEGEWCWFWDHKNPSTITVSSFVRVTEYGKFKSNTGNVWNYCAKFIGELPEHLKVVK